MRLCFFIFCLISYNALSAQDALDEVVNKDYEEERLSYILLNLGDRYDINIRYNESMLPETKYTYSFKDMMMRDVLRILLNDKGLHFKEYKSDHIIIVPADQIEVDSLLTTTKEVVNKNILASVVLGADQSGTSTAKIIGTIIDARDFDAVSSALVINNSTGSYLTADASGNFELLIDTGKYTFQFNSIAHEPYSITVDIQGSDVWEVLLDPKAYLIDEVVISGSSTQNKTNEAIMGIEQISRKEIKQMALFMGEADVIKSVLSLAGVSTTGDGASGFNVRGGSIDQNLIVQDGTLLFNPSHVLGFFSTFNPDIVRNTTLAKGHIPAYYGGRVSSVLDVKIKDANNDFLKLNGSIGMISSKASAEIPIIKSKSSLLLSGRRSYATWIIGQIKDPDVNNSRAAFNDYNLKYTHNFDDKTKASLSYFQSFDQFSFTDQFGYSWQNKIGQVEVKRILNDNMSLSFSSSISSLNNKQFQPEGVFAFELSSGVDYNQSDLQVLWTPGDHEIRIGATYVNYDNQTERLKPIEDSNTLSEEAPKEDGRELAFYINEQYEISDRFAIDAGLRLSLYSQIGPYSANLYNDESNISIDQIIGTKEYEAGTVVSYSGLEPRISMRYNLADDISIKASYNRAFQYLQLLSNTTTPTPVDIWQVSNPYIKPLMADNLSIGLAGGFGNYDASFDLYYKKLENTLDYRDFADLILNTNLETETLFGRGRSYGAELSIAKKGEKLSGRFSYSFSRSQHQIYANQNTTINGGDWFSANFDQPHSVKLFLNIVTSRRDRFNINFVYNTGRPITAPFGTYVVNGAVVSNFSDRNQFRLPSYHRLDLGYTFSVNRRKSARYKSDISISLYNFYARKNAFSIFFRQETGSPINALKLSVIGTIIPSISYNFQF